MRPSRTSSSSKRGRGGVPTYVFVGRDVLAQLTVWRQNPDGDYSGIVDTPRVFEFVDSFRGSGEVWTFDFATADDIVNVLRPQFAYLIQDALALRQMARDKEPLLAALDGNALMLALRCEDYWEYRLFGAVLEAELDRREPLRLEIEHGLAQAPVTYVGLTDIHEWMLDRLDEAIGFGRDLETILNHYLQQALGPAGMPGDPVEIATAARRLAQLWEDSAQWTLRCRSVRVDPKADRLIELLSIGNANMLNEIWEYGHTIVARIEEAIRAEEAGDLDGDLDLTLTITANLDEFSEELRQFGEGRSR